jgi:predicted component of type VI protein secretion system
MGPTTRDVLIAYLADTANAETPNNVCGKLRHVFEYWEILPPNRYAKQELQIGESNTQRHIFEGLLIFIA